MTREILAYVAHTYIDDRGTIPLCPRCGCLESEGADDEDESLANEGMRGLRV